MSRTVAVECQSRDKGVTAAAAPPAPARLRYLGPWHWYWQLERLETETEGHAPTLESAMVDFRRAWDRSPQSVIAPEVPNLAGRRRGAFSVFPAHPTLQHQLSGSVSDPNQEPHERQRNGGLAFHLSVAVAHLFFVPNSRRYAFGSNSATTALEPLATVPRPQFVGVVPFRKTEHVMPFVIPQHDMPAFSQR